MNFDLRLLQDQYKVNEMVLAKGQSGLAWLLLLSTRTTFLELGYRVRTTQAIDRLRPNYH